MSTPTRKQIESEIKKLRAIIDANTGDAAITRVAYAVETALRWSIEDTVDWQTPSQDVLVEAELLRKELA